MKSGLVKIRDHQSRRKKLRIDISQNWNLSNFERSLHHEGYSAVDRKVCKKIISIRSHRLDSFEWDDRKVKQKFLDSDVTLKTWFGEFVISKGNDRYYEPILHPKSMVMPMDMSSLPDPDDWVEDWYTTWQSRKDNPNALVKSGGDETMSIFSDNSNYYAHKHEKIWQPPEIGLISTIRLQIGESVSRLDPYHTSRLRHSKWRRKYLARGMLSHR